MSFARAVAIWFAAATPADYGLSSYSPGRHKSVNHLSSTVASLAETGTPQLLPPDRCRCTREPFHDSMYIMTSTSSPEWWPVLLADITEEHDDLDRIVSTLDESGWLHPTPAEGWDVRDSIGHLTYFDDAARRAVVDPSGFAAHVEEVMSGQLDPIAEHLERGRSMDGAGVLAWWREARRELLECLSAADPESRLKWYGPPMGMRSFVTARLMETWAHGQDVVDALGAARQPTKRLKHIAELGVRTRNFSYIVRGLEPASSEVTVDLEDPVEQGNIWHWGPDNAPDSVRGTALDFCLIVTERRNLADVSLQIEGDDALGWMKIAQAFAGPPGPGRPPQST